MELANEVGIVFPPPSAASNKRLILAQNIFGPHLLTRPSWLQPSNDNHATEPQPFLRELEHTLNLAATSALFVAAAVFRSVHGSWILNRTYISRHPDYPSGVSTGTAEFIPRQHSSSSSTSQESQGANNVPCNVEYLYSEQTELTTSSGSKLAGTKQYIYQYDEPSDKLEVYFAKRDSGSSLDSLFHRVDFEGPSENAPLKSPWGAKASHWCSPDTYEVRYMFISRVRILRNGRSSMRLRVRRRIILWRRGIWESRGWGDVFFFVFGVDI